LRLVEEMLLEEMIRRGGDGDFHREPWLLCVVDQDGYVLVKTVVLIFQQHTLCVLLSWLGGSAEMDIAACDRRSARSVGVHSCNRAFPPRNDQ
jgi:hypothetical protein